MMKFRQPEVPLILDVANMIKPLDPADQAIIVDLLDDDEQAALLVHFVPEYLAGILRQLDDKSVAELVEEVSTPRRSLRTF